MTLKALLSKTESEDYEADFHLLRKEALTLLNQLANENSQLKKSLEEKTSETIGINAISQLENSWPEGFEGHPMNENIPIRKIGRNGRKWEHYQEMMETALYREQIQEIFCMMAEQGFLDTDMLDALFACADGSRRLSLHNYNALIGVRKDE
jgi:hypothetical protein